MKNIYLTQQKQLLARYPTCKFLGQNKISQEVNLENCKVENCQIEAKVDLKDLIISNAIILPKKQKNKKTSKNNFLSKKYYDFLLNFDKKLFFDIFLFFCFFGDIIAFEIFTSFKSTFASI